MILCSLELYLIQYFSKIVKTIFGVLPIFQYLWIIVICFIPNIVYISSPDILDPLFASAFGEANESLIIESFPDL